MITITQLQHELVSKHEILSKDDKKIVLEKLKINTEKNLPHIFPDDPALQELNAKLGDIVKITRKSPTAGLSVYYRLVV